MIRKLLRPVLGKRIAIVAQGFQPLGHKHRDAIRLNRRFSIEVCRARPIARNARQDIREPIVIANLALFNGPFRLQRFA